MKALFTISDPAGFCRIVSAYFAIGSFISCCWFPNSLPPSQKKRGQEGGGGGSRSCVTFFRIVQGPLTYFIWWIFTAFQAIHHGTFSGFIKGINEWMKALFMICDPSGFLWHYSRIFEDFFLTFQKLLKILFSSGIYWEFFPVEFVRSFRSEGSESIRSRSCNSRILYHVEESSAGIFTGWLQDSKRRSMQRSFNAPSMPRRSRKHLTSLAGSFILLLFTFGTSWWTTSKY